MSDKKYHLKHSQMLGIVWLSVALLIIGGVCFFSFNRELPEPQNDSTEHSNSEKLAQKEDSAYRSRYKQKKHNHIHISNSPQRDKNNTDSPQLSAPAPKRQPLVVDLNTADTLTLQLLYGIGPAFAGRIVRYRDRLGGFVDISQLLEVKGITPEMLTKIAPCLVLDTTAIRRIEVNNTGLKQLLKHPYIEYYQARDIVQLRQHGVVFRSADDLRAIPSMADTTLQRLLPYLDFCTSYPSTVTISTTQ